MGFFLTIPTVFTKCAELVFPNNKRAEEVVSTDIIHSFILGSYLCHRGWIVEGLFSVYAPKGAQEWKYFFIGLLESMSTFQSVT